MNMLMYGAGSIGRGFIGPLFAGAGYAVTFVDVDPVIVAQMNVRRSYPVRIVGDGARTEEVTGIAAIDGRDTGAVREAIASCEIMAVSLGAAVLERVAPVIAAGLVCRWQRGGGPLDLLICENLKDAAHHLRGWLEQAMPEEYRPISPTYLGLVETAIGRMVPVVTAALRAADPLLVPVEDYDFLPVDEAAFVNPLPQLPQLVPHAPFAFYEDRKLYLHNMGHAICAYLGQRCGYEYIWQAVGDSAIRLLVEGAMIESASVLSARYNVPFHTLFAHGEDLLLRFGNRALGDTCLRVGRDPMRKLAADDRLAAPLRLCLEENRQPVCIAMGLAAAAGSLGDAVKLPALLRDTCRLSKKGIDLVMDCGRELRSGKTPEELFAFVERRKRFLRGKTV